MSNYIKGVVGDTIPITLYVNTYDDIKPDRVVFACKDLGIEQELTYSINESGEYMWTHTFNATETASWVSGIYTVTFCIYIQNVVQSKSCDFLLQPNYNLTR